MCSCISFVAVMCHLKKSRSLLWCLMPLLWVYYECGTCEHTLRSEYSVVMNVTVRRGLLEGGSCFQALIGARRL